MKNALILLGGASAIALIFPSVFQEYRHRMEIEQRREAVAIAPPVTKASVDVPGPSDTSVQLNAGPDGHFRTQARLNGAAVDMLVDTGATYVSINEDLARRLGIGLGPADFRYKATSASGDMAVAVTRIASIEIGTLTVHDVDVMVARGNTLTTALLGMSFLTKLKRFGVESGRLNLEQ